MPFLGNLTGVHLILLVAVLVLLFGATKLPALAKGLGQSARILKQELRSGTTEDASPAPHPVAVAEPIES